MSDAIDHLGSSVAVVGCVVATLRDVGVMIARPSWSAQVDLRFVVPWKFDLVLPNIFIRHPGARDHRAQVIQQHKILKKAISGIISIVRYVGSERGVPRWSTPQRQDREGHVHSPYPDVRTVPASPHSAGIE